jgi:hypothetical protein
MEQTKKQMNTDAKNGKTTKITMILGFDPLILEVQGDSKHWVLSADWGWMTAIYITILYDYIRNDRTAVPAMTRMF